MITRIVPDKNNTSEKSLMESTANLLPIRRALISTFDKSGLLALCKALTDSNVEIISTGNTARYLRSNGFEITDVETITNFPEILGGRVKTLHPHIFSGILARRNAPSHMETLNIQEIDTIDLVVVNLYPFEKTVSAPGSTFGDCIEQVDIGGPSLIRAAAKNFEHVAVLCDPVQYETFISRYEQDHGTLLEDRKSWAADGFWKTAQYDQSISAWMGGKPLRYGENPHQKAKLFVSCRDEIPLASTRPIHGKELSYNNLLDAHCAILSLRCLMKNQSASYHGCVIIKHGTPCGASLGGNLSVSVANAFATDPLSAFGGIVAISSNVDAGAAEILKSHFLELILAQSFSKEAIEILTQKKDLRLLELPTLLTAAWPKESMRSIFGGFLLQELDTPDNTDEIIQLVTLKKPSDAELQDLKTAMNLAIPCLSNAITIVRNGQLIGVGAGQTSRVDAVKIALAKAKEHGHNLAGAVLASDGFFPFPDSLILAKEAGISSIIQPGGSKKDADVIAKANDLELSMAFTQVRHFRH